MSNLNRYLAPTAEEVAKIREDVLRLRTCGLQGHSALFYGHTESLVTLLDLYQAALAYLGDERNSHCPGCKAAPGTTHGADCWVRELIDQAVAVNASPADHG